VAKKTLGSKPPVPAKAPVKPLPQLWTVNPVVPRVQVPTSPIISGRAGVGPIPGAVVPAASLLKPPGTAGTKTYNVPAVGTELVTNPSFNPLASPLKPTPPPPTQFEQARESRYEAYAAQWGLAGTRSKVADRAAALAASLAAWATPYAAGVIGTPAWYRRMGGTIKQDASKTDFGALKQRPTTGFDGGGYDYGGGGGGGRGGGGSYNGGSGLINWRIGY